MEIKYLTSKSVTIISNGNAKSYKNSNIGRKKLKKETNTNIYNKVIEKWGSTPLTFKVDETLIENGTNNTLSLKERITALEEALILLTE